MKKIMLARALLISTNALKCMDRNKGDDPKKQIIIADEEMRKDATSVVRATMFFHLLLATQDKRVIRRPKSKL